LLLALSVRDLGVRFAAKYPAMVAKKSFEPEGRGAERSPPAHEDGGRELKG
jgi:hypothetical protein